jgi:hypothetical protein
VGVDAYEEEHAGEEHRGGSAGGHACGERLVRLLVQRLRRRGAAAAAGIRDGVGLERKRSGDLGRLYAEHQDREDAKVKTLIAALKQHDGANTTELLKLTGWGNKGTVKQAAELAWVWRRSL